MQHSIGMVAMPANAFAALLTLESIGKTNVVIVKSGMVVCYNAAWKHEPITLYADDVE
jgi:hypothetical protein